MATSLCSSTDSNNLPPIEFQFSTSVCSEDSASGSGTSSGLTVAVERCPLCDCRRRPFYCKICVNEGKFIHSSATYLESYTDKKTKFEIAKKTHQEILSRFEISVSKQHRIDNKKSEIEDCRARINLLKLAIQATKESTTKGKELLDANRKENIVRHAKNKKHQEKMARINNFIEQSVISTESKQLRLKEKVEELARLRHELVNGLIEYIFPVEEVKGKNVADCMALSTVSALRDASHTAFLRGKWVYTDGSGDVQYKIVEPTLPGSGDYSSYSLWVATSKENAENNPDYSSQNPGHRISAALCYTSQLLSVMSHILDFRLPRRQCYSEFCGGEMTEKRFESCVAALNYNILYVCFSQGITDIEVLYPKNTLQNMLALISAPKLGRLCSFEVNEDLMKSIDELCSSYEEEDEKTSVFDNEDDLSPDWDCLPDDVPDMVEIQASRSELGVASNIQYTSYPHHTSSSEASQLSASALVSSAAASLASFFNRATDKR